MYIKTIVLLSCIASPLLHASVGLEMYFGVATDSSGAAVPDGTLWALVVDDGDSSFPGGLGLNAGLATAGANAFFTTGQQFEIGSSFGADKVFAFGGFNGLAKSGIAGYHSDLISLDLSASLASGKNTAVYFFPGALFKPTEVKQTIGSQVGGLNASADTVGGMDGMVVPSDSFTVKYGALSPAVDGTTPADRFGAVNLVPEPSSVLIGLLGALGLLRRKRN